MRKKEVPPDLDSQDEQFICALMREDTKAAAARAAGISRAALYRRLQDPEFMAAYRAASDDALCALEKNALKAVKVLVATRSADSSSGPRLMAVAVRLAFRFYLVVVKPTPIAPDSSLEFPQDRHLQFHVRNTA